MTKRLQILFTLLVLGTYNTVAQTYANLQIINNCADVSYPEIDVWVNNMKVAPNLQFRHATIFMGNINAGTPINIGIAPANSINITDTFYNSVVTLTANTKNIIVINGLRLSAGYSSFKPLSINLLANTTDIASSPSNVDLIFNNGVTDGVTYDFRSGLNILADNVAYNTYNTNIASMAASDIKVRTTNITGITKYNTYLAPLSDPTILGKTCIVIASGFVNPSANNNGASMGLWMTNGNGGSLIEWSPTTPEALARVQFIHNCADTTADTVDIYADANKIANDFSFRNATEFMEFLGNTSTTIAVAPRNSTNSADAFYTMPLNFDSAGTHIVIASGIQSASGYTPMESFRLTKFNGAREQATNSSNTDVLFYNGCTDAGSLTVNVGSPWFSNIGFDNFSSGYNSSPTANSILTLQKSGGGTTGYWTDFTNNSLQGAAITLVASGFDDTTKNSKGAKLHLYYARANGGPMTRMPPYALAINEIDNSDNNIQLYPIPANNKLFINSKISINTLSIFGSNGNLISEKVVMNNNILDIASLIPGNYILVINTRQGAYTKVFIKQ